MFIMWKFGAKVVAGVASVFMMFSPFLPWIHAGHAGNVNLFSLATSGTHLATFLVGYGSVGVGVLLLVVLKLKKLVKAAVVAAVVAWIAFAGAPMVTHFINGSSASPTAATTSSSPLEQCTKNGGLPGSYSIASLAATPNATCDKGISNTVHSLSTSSSNLLHAAKAASSTIPQTLSGNFYLIEGIAVILAIGGGILGLTPSAKPTIGEHDRVW